jgi:hypothetical protein
MYSAEIDLPAVPAEKNLELKSRGDEQSPDIRFAQENVAGGMAAAVGAANTAEAQSPGVERTFPALGTPVNISLVNGSVERKDGSLLPGPLVGDKKNLLREREGCLGREGFEPSKAEPTDLQSAPFDHSGTSPFVAEEYRMGPGLSTAGGLLRLKTCGAATAGSPGRRRPSGHGQTDLPAGSRRSARGPRICTGLPGPRGCSPSSCTRRRQRICR